MIEIVFSESACGGLKIAQHYGEGEYSGRIPGFCFYGDETPTEAEIQIMQTEFAEKARLEWENAVPMGGNTQDIFGFELSLSTGDISNENFITKRGSIMADASRSIWPDAYIDDINDFSRRQEESLNAALSRAANGDDIRIWYSNHPDEMCGLYWFMSKLYQYEEKLGNVYIVKLPEYLYHNNYIINQWGEISTGAWAGYTALAEITTAIFHKHCADQWRNLQEENSPLRVVLNGQLVSAPETIYDFYIFNEIEKENDQFSEAKIICNLVENLRCSIPNAWIHFRIEKMINDGKLVVVKEPEEDHPLYAQILRKTNLVL